MLGNSYALFLCMMDGFKRLRGEKLQVFMRETLSLRERLAAIWGVFSAERGSTARTHNRQVILWCETLDQVDTESVVYLVKWDLCDGMESDVCTFVIGDKWWALSSASGLGCWFLFKASRMLKEQTSGRPVTCRLSACLLIMRAVCGIKASNPRQSVYVPHSNQTLMYWYGLVTLYG